SCGRNGHDREHKERFREVSVFGQPNGGLRILKERHDRDQKRGPDTKYDLYLTQKVKQVSQDRALALAAREVLESLHEKGVGNGQGKGDRAKQLQAGRFI